MAGTKTATLTFRIEPGLKVALREALRAAAEREHRSIANMVEVMIRDYCGRNQIAVSDKNDQSDSAQNGRGKANP